MPRLVREGRDSGDLLGQGRIFMWLALLFINFAIYVSCHTFPGELPDGRWENAIGGGRVSAVIRLEDQHGDRDDDETYMETRK